MRSELLDIVMSAQVAASAQALNNIRASHMDRYGYSGFELNSVTEHKLASALVKEAGLPGFLCEHKDQFKPLWSGRIGRDTHGESWTNCAVYSLAEAEAYAKAIGADWFSNLKEAQASSFKEKDVCQDCHDGYLTVWRNDLHCSMCASEYPTEYGAIQKLGSDLSGFYATSSGPGRYFSHTGFTRLTKRHIVVTQHCGYDI